MIKYIIVAPTSNVDLLAGTTDIRVLGYYENFLVPVWLNPTLKKEAKYIKYFDTREEADSMIKETLIMVAPNAFSYGVEVEE